jgi:hypothetical protein
VLQYQAPSKAKSSQYKSTGPINEPSPLSANLRSSSGASLSGSSSGNAGNTSNSKFSVLFLIGGARRVGSFKDHEIFQCTRMIPIPLLTGTELPKTVQSSNENIIGDTQRFLESGDFYFSTTLDLTVNLQSQNRRGTTATSNSSMWQSSDAKFLWNLSSTRYFIKNQLQQWIQPLIRGHVELSEFYVGSSNRRLGIGIISRIGAARAGTKYLRGLNDDGDCAQFTETEQITWEGNSVFSFVQIRGSVPVFWERKNVAGKSKYAITRKGEATFPAFMKHVDDLILSYGSKVFVFNLLSRTKEKESTISSAFEEQIRLWNLKKQSGNSNSNQTNKSKPQNKRQNKRAKTQNKNKLLYFV